MRWTCLAAFLLLPLQAQQITTAARQADLNYVADIVPARHANFFFQLNPARYNQAVANLQAQISTLSDAEFYVSLAGLLALAGDPHTFIALTGARAAVAGFQSYPLQFRWLDDGVFVTAAAAPYTQALGAQLVAVNGVPIAQVVQSLSTIIPAANDQWLHHRAAEYLLGEQILQGLHVLPVNATSPLTFQTLAGSQFTLQVGTGAAAMQAKPDPSTG